MVLKSTFDIVQAECTFVKWPLEPESAKLELMLLLTQSQDSHANYIGK
jgi:hypothetical protein